jgi:hypothetical protein
LWDQTIFFDLLLFLDFMIPSIHIPSSAMWRVGEEPMLDSDFYIDVSLSKLREKWARETDRAAKARGMKVRGQLARRGYRLMHRRKGQYWVMFDIPMTLDEIEAWLEPRQAQ